MRSIIVTVLLALIYSTIGALVIIGFLALWKYYLSAKAHTWLEKRAAKKEEVGNS